MDPRLAKLREKNIFVGTSSWKYEGWKGLVYQKKYPSAKAFNNGCLEEYAEHYTTVGIDHTYYAWPLSSTIQKYVSQTPEGFRFGLKATERITVWKYPNLKRYGKEAGKLNESFLAVEEFRKLFLEPLRPFKDRIGPIMLEFSQFYPGTISSGSEFCERMDRFFTELNEPQFQLGIELRNANWLKPPYFALLEKHGVTHVFNSWTRMPTLREQVEAAGEAKLPSYVARLLLRPGVKYEQAVEAYAPYDRVQDEQPELRVDAALLVGKAIRAGRPAFVFVNNRAEGSAPYTISGILDLIEK